MFFESCNRYSFIQIQKQQNESKDSYVKRWYLFNLASLKSKFCVCLEILSM